MLILKFLWPILCLTHVKSEKHPYKFENPLSNRKSGLTENERMPLNEDFVNKFESGDDWVDERDRSSLGESEIRSGIINKTLLANTSDDHLDSSVDLLTSQSLPVPLSLRRKSQDESSARLRNHNLSSKPARRKPIIPIYDDEDDEEEDDDEEYYYIYEEDDNDQQTFQKPLKPKPKFVVKSGYDQRSTNYMGPRPKPSGYLREPG